jgi:BMFP domain-containing protein YqiC
MLDPRLLEQVVSRLSALAPPGLDRLQEDAGRGLRAAVAAALERLDLVTRAEFDAQVAVLARTREMIEGLERRVLALERALGAGGVPSGAPPVDAQRADRPGGTD